MTERLEIKATLTVDDAGEISGIAWPFGSPDRVGDVIEKGAITAPAIVPMLFAHDQAQSIGVWDSISETAEGLTVKGRLLIDEVARAREVHALIKAKAVTGLSIGFVTKSAKPRQRGRTITALALHEISVVAVPCHPGAQITSIKAADGTASHERTERMEDEIENAPEAKADPVIEKKDFDALKARMDKFEAKANRPVAANDNHPAAANDNMKAFEAELRESLLEKKALTVATPGTAGNLVRDDFSATILEKIRPASPVRQLARVVAVGSSLLQIPRLVNRVVPGSVTEVQQKPESEPTFEQIDIKNFAMGVMTPVSRTALEDSAVNLVDFLQSHIVSEFGTLESEWFVTGNGTTQAEGVLTSTEVENVEATAIDTDALLDTFYGVKSAYALNGAWLMNRKTMRVVRGLRDSDGNLLWQSGLQAGQPGLLLGKPVYECDYMPDAAEDATPIIFGDFARGYTITDRVTFEPHADYSTRFGEDIVVFGGRRRVGGKVVMGEALIKLLINAVP
ncbi:phage major capsid protein [Nitratireductor luteus]|uniref:phage major capsid protein n=1 Tax=Nitratireductor luteus TaxID=2976980 RepID=UPI00223ED99B|nr:phage major capsid protein [Nitratireductor luteus]